MRTNNKEIVAELMVANDLPNLMYEVEEHLYIDEYMMFEAFITNAGVVFSNPVFLNDPPIEEEDESFILRVEDLDDYMQEILATYQELLKTY